MRSSSSPSLRLLSSEKARVRTELDGMLMHLDTVEQHLTVASWRSGALISTRTEKRLDTIRQALSELSETVERTPVDGD